MVTAAPAVLLRLAEDARFRRFVEERSLSRDLVSRFVAGESVSSAVDVTGELLARGRRVSVALLADDPLDRTSARDNRKRLRKVLRRLGQAGLVGPGSIGSSGEPPVEVMVRLGALGGRLTVDPDAIATDNARAVAESAAVVGARVTLEAEPGMPVAQALGVVDALREQHPDAGIELVASRRRTETDVAERIASACRVRLSKTDSDTGDALDPRQTDLAYVRGLAALMRSDVPFSMTAEDARIVDIADTLVARGVRERGTFEYHLRLGQKPMVSASISDRGDLMRVYVPFGAAWYPYLIGRIAEQPGRLGALLRPARQR